MKKTFIGSLICPNGIIGGGISIDEESITYKTNKLTVDRRYKNLVLPINEIREMMWKQFVFPIATIQMADGEQYKFIIFNKSRFDKYYIEFKR